MHLCLFLAPLGEQFGARGSPKYHNKSMINCYPFGSSGDPTLNELGGSDLRGLVTTKVRTDLCGLILSVFMLDPCLFLLRLWLVSFVFEVSARCSSFVYICSKMAHEFISKGKKFGPGVPRRNQNRSMGHPPGVPQNRLQTKTCYWTKQSSKWLQNQRPNTNNWRSMANIFRHFSTSFF